MSDIAVSHRWVADATAARRAARANFGHLVRDKRRLRREIASR